MPLSSNATVLLRVQSELFDFHHASQKEIQIFRDIRKGPFRSNRRCSPSEPASLMVSLKVNKYPALHPNSFIVSLPDDLGVRRFVAIES